MGCTQQKLEVQPAMKIKEKPKGPTLAEMSALIEVKLNNAQSKPLIFLNPK